MEIERLTEMAIDKGKTGIGMKMKEIVRLDERLNDNIRDCSQIRWKYIASLVERECI